MSNQSWNKICQDHKILKHNFDESPFTITAKDIKRSVQEFTKTADKEVRILCTQTSRKDVPRILRENNLFLLPIKNGKYVIIQGEGYVDIPTITSDPILHQAKLDWEVKAATSGNSEMQHIDYAYVESVIKTFMKDESLIFVIRGRKYSKRFQFYVGKHQIEVEGVQMEVDAGYEGREQVVLIEAKNTKSQNTIIRQLYYPFRHWSLMVPDKRVRNIFFEKRGEEYMLWEYGFRQQEDYNSIYLVRSSKYTIQFPCDRD